MYIFRSLLAVKKRFNNIHITLASSLTFDLEKLPSKLYSYLFPSLFHRSFCSNFKHQEHDVFKVKTDEKMSQRFSIKASVVSLRMMFYFLTFLF